MEILLQALTYHRGSDTPLSMLVILLVRATLVVATGWLASRLLCRSSAAVQHRIWLLTALGMLIVPLVWALTPGWRVPLMALEVPAAGTFDRFVPPDVAPHAAWPELLVVAWIVGALATLAYTLVGLLLARRLFHGSRPCTDTLWLNLLAAARSDAALVRRVELRVTDRAISPAVWSFRRVQILLPADALRWTLAERRSVLVHELAHVARHDCLVQLLANLASAVWWFHPLSWYVAGRVRACGELAADDCVIRADGRPADYAGHLLAIASALGPARSPLGAQTMYQPSHLEQRLRAILDPHRQRGPLERSRSWASLAAACLLVWLLATLSPSVVRTVAAEPPAAAPRRLDLKVNVRVTIPLVPVAEPLAPRPPAAGQPLLIPDEVLKFYQGQLKQPKTADVPRRGTAELVPLWEVGRRAEQLIPNHVPGTSQIVLLKQPMPATAALAVSPAESPGLARPLAPTETSAANPYAGELTAEKKLLRR